MPRVVAVGTSTHATAHLQEWAWDIEQADAKGGGFGSFCLVKYIHVLNTFCTFFLFHFSFMLFRLILFDVNTILQRFGIV